MSVCAVHRSHAPRNLTIEVHHIVPVGWQHIAAWQPAMPPFPGPDTEGRGELWDDRTIVLCPTGHRNVHTLIVALMHGEKPRKSAELPIAQDALARFQAVGGDLDVLRAAGEWGES